MTNASAMTLVLILFIALFCAAVFVILSGGRVFERLRPLRLRSRDKEDHRRAA